MGIVVTLTRAEPHRVWVGTVLLAAASAGVDEVGAAEQGVLSV